MKMGRLGVAVSVLAVVAACTAAGETGDAGDTGDAAREDVLRMGRAALDDGLYAVAEEKFDDYLQSAKEPEERLAASLLLAETFHAQSRMDDALAALAPYLKGNPEEEQDPGVVYWAAAARLGQGQAAESLHGLDDFGKRYPESVYVGPAQQLRIRALLKEGDLKHALKGYEHFAKEHPDSPQAPDNLLDWAATLLREDRAKKASSVLARLTRDYPDSLAAARGGLWMSRLKVQAGEPAGAVDLLKTLSENETLPRALRAEAFEELARAYRQQGQHAEAAEALVQGTALVQDPQHRLVLTLQRGLDLVEQEDQQEDEQKHVEEGLALFQEAVVAVTNAAVAAEYQLKLGDTLLRQEEFARARDVFQQYLEAFPDESGQAQAHEGKAWSLWALTQFGEAAAEFQKAYDLAESPAVRETVLLKAADASFANRQYPEARELYEQFRDIFPESPRVLQAAYQRAECLAREDRRDEALAAFRELATADDPAVAGKAAMRSIRMYEDAGAWKEALAGYDVLLAAFKDPDLRARALHGRGLVAYRLGLFKEALQNFDELVRLYPEHPLVEQASYMRGWALYLMGNTKEALAICSEFIVNYPKSVWAPDVLFWLGEYYYNHGDYASAEKRFKELAASHPKVALAEDATYWAGRAAAAQQQYVRAIEYYTALTKDYPESEWLTETRFAQGDALSELGQFDRAILAFEEVVHRAPDSYLVNLAWGRIGDCHFTLATDDPDRYQTALGCYRTVFDRPETSGELKLQAEYKAGRCYEKMGETDKALEYYMNVVYRFFLDWEKGQKIGPVWFTRAAFSAAALEEGRDAWDAALKIYARVVEAGVPAAADARKRAHKIKMEHWWPLLKEQAGAVRP